MEVRTTAEWISVKERLPEWFGWYLVCSRGRVEPVWFDITGWSNMRWPQYVTHWMPLPEPPKEAEHD